MKISEINISPLFISGCLITFLFCGIMAMKGEIILWINLFIFGIIGFIIIDLFQIIICKELFVSQNRSNMSDNEKEVENGNKGN